MDMANRRDLMEPGTTNVDRLYHDLRQMAADFAFKPGERVNETMLSRSLGASRTPLREALNRLVAEGFMTFQPGRGFFCRTLDPDRIVALYELRVAIECEAVRLAIMRASDEAIAAEVANFHRTEPDYSRVGDPLALLRMDERFHVGLTDLSGNPELARQLDTLNGRIRFVRTMDLVALARARPDKPNSMSAHRTIVDALVRRDEVVATRAMRSHIERRLDQATAAVRNAYATLYVPDDKVGAT